MKTTSEIVSRLPLSRVLEIIEDGLDSELELRSIHSKDLLAPSIWGHFLDDGYDKDDFINLSEDKLRSILAMTLDAENEKRTILEKYSVPGREHIFSTSPNMNAIKKKSFRIVEGG